MDWIGWLGFGDVAFLYEMGESLDDSDARQESVRLLAVKQS